MRLREALFDYSAPGGWSSLDFARRLFVIQNFWPYNELQKKGQKAFLSKMLSMQLKYIFSAIRKSDGKISSGEIHRILRQIFAFRGAVACLMKQPVVAGLIFVYTYLPFGKRIVMVVSDLHKACRNKGRVSELK